MDENSWFYFYSANAQVFAALIAILGVFTVYALEWIQKSIEWNRSDLIQLFKPFGINLECSTLDPQLNLAQEKLQEFRNKSNSNPKFEEIEKVLESIKNQRELKKVIPKKFLKLMVFKLCILAVSLVMLPWLSIYKFSRCFGAFTVIVVLILSVIALVWTGRYIRDTLSQEAVSK